MTVLDNVRLEIAEFMRGKYRLDEIAGKFYEADCLKFRQGKKTIVSINFRENCYEFQIIFGAAEREKFEARRGEFGQMINEIYDNSTTHKDGKWMLIPVADIKTWAEVKKLILIKKNPNRKPYDRASAVYGKCGHRCDLCVHYANSDEAFRATLVPHLINVYGITDWSMRCTGCDTPGCQCYHEGGEVCQPIICLREKGLSSCMDCDKYPCEEATVGYRLLEHRNLSADDVTWAILPYVPHQYGN